MAVQMRTGKGKERGSGLDDGTDDRLRFSIADFLYGISDNACSSAVYRNATRSQLRSTTFHARSSIFLSVQMAGSPLMI